MKAFRSVGETFYQYSDEIRDIKKQERPFITEAKQKRLMLPFFGFRHLLHTFLNTENQEFHYLCKLFGVVKKADFLISTNMQRKFYENQYLG